MPVVSRRVQDRVNDNGVLNHAEDNPIRKPVRICPTHLQSPGADTVEQRIVRQTCQLGADGLNKLAAKPGLLLFIPSLGLEEVGSHFRADNEAIFTRPISA